MAGPLRGLSAAKLWPTASSSALMVSKRVMAVFIGRSSWLSGTPSAVSTGTYETDPEADASDHKKSIATCRRCNGRVRLPCSPPQDAAGRPGRFDHRVNRLPYRAFPDQGRGVATGS